MCAVGLIGLGFLRLVPRRLLLPATLVGVAVCLSTYGFAQDYASDGYADLLWAAAAAAAVMFLLILPDRPEHLVIGLVAASVAGLTKNDGLPIAVLILGMTALRHRGHLRQIAPVLASVVALLALWPLLARLGGAGSDLLGGLRPPGAPAAVTHNDWSRYHGTLRSLKPWVLHLGEAAVACTVGGLLVSRGKRRLLGLGSTFLVWTVIVGELVALVSAYVLSPYDLGWHLATSIERTTIAPRLLLIVEIGCWMLCSAMVLWPQHDAASGAGQSEAEGATERSDPSPVASTACG
jgi:hypothetical protein